MINWFNQKKTRIFLDYASATPVSKEVREVMDRYWARAFYNPSGIYDEGRIVKKELNEARIQVARLLGVTREGVIFTSSGTESDNLAILGTFEIARKFMKRPHIVISAIEHPAVMQAAEEVRRRGGELTVLPVDEEGLVSVEELEKALKPSTFLVSISLANSEIGTLEPLARIGRAVRKYRKGRKLSYPYLHTDASAAVSFVPVDMEKLQADLITLDGSKIYGPKGVGVLLMRRDVDLHPQIFGGGQEFGLRSGTPNTALIAGFARALEIAIRDQDKEQDRLEKLRTTFITYVSKNFSKAIFNGSLEAHVPNIISISVPNILSELLVLKLDTLGVLASVGSACSYDEKVSGSPVIRALNKGDFSESTIRFSLGRFTTLDDVKNASEIFCKTLKDMLK